MSKTKQEVVLNPGRQEVYNIIVHTVNESEGDPAQTFADILTAMVVIGHMVDVDQEGIPDLVATVSEMAAKAAEILVSEMEETDG